MAAHEFLASIDWQFWIPVGIAAASLILTIRTTRRANKRQTMLDLEKKVDKASEALTDCEENLRRCGHEKDELRRENVELLRQVASMAKQGE